MPGSLSITQIKVVNGLRYGINVPNFDYHDPGVLATLAREAEEADWDGFFIWDHIHGDTPFGDPTVALTAIATNTERIRFGVMITPLRARVAPL